MTNTITIPVSETNAATFNAGSPEMRREIETLVEERLAAETRRAAWDRMSVLMDKMGAEAKANGLTEEILEELLRDE